MAEPSWALQQALAASLAAALNPVAIYDNVPPSAVKPYGVIGDDALTEDFTKPDPDDDEPGEEAWLVVATIEFWDDVGRGRKTVKQLISQAYDALHEAALSVTGFRVNWVRYASSSTTRSDDGLTYLGRITFNLRIERVA